MVTMEVTIMITDRSGTVRPAMHWLSACVLLGALLPVTGWCQGPAGYPGAWNYPPYAGATRGYHYHYTGSLRVQTGTSEDGYYVRVRLDGLRPGDIQVYVRHGRLVLQTGQGGESGPYRPGARGDMQWQVHVRRELRLPYDADVSRMTTSTENGIMEILLPFRER
jgi:HSP20 family molecular chaperone IbpA